MKRNNSGKLIAFDSSEDSEARQSIESWCEYLLCGTCEKRISRWETISIEMLRKTGISIEKSGNPHGGLMQNYDYPTLRLFMLSVLWRASVSTLPEFSTIVLPTEYQEGLRRALHLEISLRTLALNCRMMKIVDHENIFTAKNFENIVVSPAIDPVGANGKCTFIFGGYVSEFFVPRMPFSVSGQLGVLRPKQEQFIPAIEMTKLPRLMALFDAGRQKNRSVKRAH